MCKIKGSHTLPPLKEMHTIKYKLCASQNCKLYKEIWKLSVMVNKIQEEK